MFSSSNKGRLPVTDLMNFRKTSKRPLTPPPPPPYFRKKMLRFFWEARKFATKFIRIGVTPPFFTQKITEKTATKFFGSEMTHPPPEVFQKFFESVTESLPL